jgi:predicted NBD/HSP70 family sugar kinase
MEGTFRETHWFFSSMPTALESFDARPQVLPPLDHVFRPAASWNRAFADLVIASGSPVPIRFALEQSSGAIFCHEAAILPSLHPQAKLNFRFAERLLKFLLWSRGGHQIYFDGPLELGDALRAHFKNTATGRFDADFMSTVYERPFEVLLTTDLPVEKNAARQLGRHLDGCRIGFDLGGSDRKVAAVIDGEVVFSEETAWDPYYQEEPDYHCEGIADSLRKAAKHLPKVEAIGGSSAGVYVENQPRVASLFRGVPEELFDSRVKSIFLDFAKEWNVPFEVINDGDVTALAGSMSLVENAVLGLAMGTSEATGYVNAEGKVTTWLNELAFAPIDYAENAPADEWSGDRGCGVQYFSQQAVGRLLAAAEIDLPNELSLPEKLVEVQALMASDDLRARKIYETIGVYLGYGVAHYADLYNMRNLLLLGRVTSGSGGQIILDQADNVLKTEFPELAERIAFHVPSEKDKRHGQAIAAASLPVIER